MLPYHLKFQRFIAYYPVNGLSNRTLFTLYPYHGIIVHNFTIVNKKLSGTFRNLA